MRAMRWLERGWMAALAVSVAAACASFGETPAPLPDASRIDDPDAAATPDARLPRDGAAATPGCTILVNDGFDGTSAAWTLLGTAKVDAGQAELTADDPWQRGAIWLSLPTAVDAGKVHARFFTDVRGDSNWIADGLTLAWSAQATAPSLGSPGSDLGLCLGGTVGAALALRTADREMQLLAVDNSCMQLDGGLTVAFFGEKPVDVTIEGTSVAGTFDGRAFSFALPRAVPIRSIGFTGATGNGRARHAVAKVLIEACP